MWWSSHTTHCSPSSCWPWVLIVLFSWRTQLNRIESGHLCIETPSFAQINSLVSTINKSASTATISATQLHEQRLNWIDPPLIPTPRLHFLMTGYTALTSEHEVRSCEILLDTWKNGLWFLRKLRWGRRRFWMSWGVSCCSLSEHERRHHMASRVWPHVGKSHQHFDGINFLIFGLVIW